MVVFEERELEEFVFDSKADVIVPIEIYCSSDDSRPVITTYSRCRYVADQLEARFGTDVIRPEAVKWLEGAMKEIVDLWGYEFDTYYSEPICEFLISSACELNEELIGSHTRLFTSAEQAEEYECLTLHTVEPEADVDDDAAAAVVINGKIVACASINDYWDYGNYPEINVETAVEYRGRGYATSAVVALCRFLFDKGYKGASYKCRESNMGSVGVARKAGFKETGRRINFVCYKKKG